MNLAKKISIFPNKCTKNHFDKEVKLGPQKMLSQNATQDNRHAKKQKAKVPIPSKAIPDQQQIEAYVQEYFHVSAAFSLSMQL